MKRKSLGRIKGLDAADALAPRCQPSPSQENLQDQKIRIRDRWRLTSRITRKVLAHILSIIRICHECGYGELIEDIGVFYKT